MRHSPYRSTSASDELSAQTALGKAVLRVEPRHTRLELGTQIWTVADEHLTVITEGKRKPKKRSYLLRSAKLYVAKAWPTNEVGLWIEQRPGVVQRLLGLPPMPGFDEEVMQAWRDLDKLSRRLQKALARYSKASSALELGQGGHRVFARNIRDGLAVYARPVFRERPRRVVEVFSDGTLAFPVKKKADRKIEMRRGLEVVASGDRIHFCHPDGERVAGIYLPWIGSAERTELTRRIRSFVGELRQLPSDEKVSALHAQLGQLGQLGVPY